MLQEVAHIYDLLTKLEERFPDKQDMLCRRSGKEWIRFSVKDYVRYSNLLAYAFSSMGYGKGDKVVTICNNRPEWNFTDMGLSMAGLIHVPVYPTLSADEYLYIFNHSDAKIIIIGTLSQYRKIEPIVRKMDKPARIFLMDDSDNIQCFRDLYKIGERVELVQKPKIEKIKAETGTDEPVSIIYTSGTTGTSKGVMLYHYNYLEAMRIHDIRLTMVSDKDLSMCFLPLTHIFEKAWVCYCLHKGVTVAINQDPKRITETLPQVRPTLMCNVPRFWEKVYAGVHDKIHSFPRCMQKIFMNAIETGRIYNLEYKNKGIEPPRALKSKFLFYDKTIFLMLKKAIGLDRGRFFPVAGAPLADHINEFLQSVNIPIIYGYGLSETTATVSFYPSEGFVIGSIGTIMPGLEVKIDPSNSEILVKGKTVTKGYYKRPDENEKSFTEDGFFRTGDAGRIEDGVLYFTERIKDLYKTSNGKYIAPQAIEGLVGSDRYIEQIAVIADQRKFVSALIVPNFQVLEEYVARKGLSFNSREEMVSNPDIIRMFEARIEVCQKNLAPFEKIKRITLLVEPFTMEGKELTDTLKLRRRVIAEKYAEQIEAMYKE